MQLFLVRHGEYIKDGKGVDVLSEKGHKDIAQMADFLKQKKFDIPAIWHSPKNRAVESARIFQKALHPSAGIKVFEKMKPEDPVAPVLEELSAMKKNLMLVGHLPFIPRLVSHLLTGDAEQSLMAVPTSGIVILENDRDFNWSLTGFFHPQNI